MNPAEYHQMAAVEHEHWWYRGLRDAIGRAVRRWSPPDTSAVLDAGCGTGENLRLLRELLSPAYLGGFDVSPIALDYAVRKNPYADVYQSDVCQPALHVQWLNVILCCDVLYVPGLERSMPGLQQLSAALAPGGILILNLPAYSWLRSRHDLAVHTSQRFTRPIVRQLMQALGLVPVVLTYRLCGLFPFVLAARLPSMLWPPRDGSGVRSDVVLPGPVMNGVLTATLIVENALMDRGVAWPWGSSVFAVGRKPPSAF